MPAGGSGVGKRQAQRRARRTAPPSLRASGSPCRPSSTTSRSTWASAAVVQQRRRSHRPRRRPTRARCALQRALDVEPFRAPLPASTTPRTRCGPGRALGAAARQRPAARAAARSRPAGPPARSRAAPKPARSSRRLRREQVARHVEGEVVAAGTKPPALRAQLRVVSKRGAKPAGACRGPHGARHRHQLRIGHQHDGARGMQAALGQKARDAADDAVAGSRQSACAGWRSARCIGCAGGLWLSRP